MSRIYYRENSDDLLNSETIVVELASARRIFSPIFQKGPPERDEGPSELLSLYRYATDDVTHFAH